MRVLFHDEGPPDHGVTRHARAIAHLVRSSGADVVSTGPADLSHAQFSDALWGPDVRTAAAAYERWAAGASRPLVVTLHDLPGADPDRRRDSRRGAGFARVVAASDGVIVSALHEAVKAGDLGAERPWVIELPLPVAANQPAPLPPWKGDPTVGVLGFVYPGKGHAEIIETAARQAGGLKVVALGAVSPGHESLKSELLDQAARRGVDLVVTGSLSAPALAAAISAVSVPVVPGRLVSASSSLLAWISHGRRPLTAAGSYANEVAARYPTALELYAGPDELGIGVTRARLDGPRTRLDAVPVWPDVGRLHLAAYQELLQKGDVSGAQ